MKRKFVVFPPDFLFRHKINTSAACKRMLCSALRENIEKFPRRMFFFFVLRMLVQAESEKFRVYVLVGERIRGGKCRKLLASQRERAHTYTHMMTDTASFLVSSLKSFAFRRRSFPLPPCITRF